jgi:hypothetical protein
MWKVGAKLLYYCEEIFARHRDKFTFVLRKNTDTGGMAMRYMNQESEIKESLQVFGHDYESVHVVHPTKLQLCFRQFLYALSPFLKSFHL